MIDARSRRNARGDRREPMIDGQTTGDAEARLAASLRAADDPDGGPSRGRPLRRVRLRVHAPEATTSEAAVAAMVLAVQARLPGRICDLEVRVESDQFVLTGVASSYYVKQVAQHVAMNALNELMLARLVNEIEVRSVR